MRGAVLALVLLSSILVGALCDVCSLSFAVANSSAAPLSFVSPYHSAPFASANMIVLPPSVSSPSRPRSQ